MKMVKRTEGDVKETVKKATSKWYIWVIAIVVIEESHTM